MANPLYQKHIISITYLIHKSVNMVVVDEGEVQSHQTHEAWKTEDSASDIFATSTTTAHTYP
ncbi:aspartate carbamoyltransferase, partial [Escherichia coli]